MVRWKKAGGGCHQAGPASPPGDAREFFYRLMRKGKRVMARVVPLREDPCGLGLRLPFAVSTNWNEFVLEYALSSRWWFSRSPRVLGNNILETTSARDRQRLFSFVFSAVEQKSLPFPQRIPSGQSDFPQWRASFFFRARRIRRDPACALPRIARQRQSSIAAILALNAVRRVPLMA